MKLLYGPISPYARKVRLVMHELGIQNTIELVVIDPWSDKSLRSYNPLSKIPTLILKDGSALYDSPVICEYLAEEHRNTSIFPPVGPKRWQALKLQALGDGISEAAVRIVVENRRPEGERSHTAIDRQNEAIVAALAFLEKNITLLSKDAPAIGEYAVASALGYFSFRMPDNPWKKTYPKLAGWFQKFSEHPAMKATVPA